VSRVTSEMEGGGSRCGLLPSCEYSADDTFMFCRKCMFRDEGEMDVMQRRVFFARESRPNVDFAKFPLW
jgi:hypothetical protein